jgi:two-component system phosphate regulon sensor histidine kinase PhoR
MPSRYRLTIFFSIFGAAAAALLFVLVTTEDPLSSEHRSQLLAITALGLGGAVVAAVLISSLIAAPFERRVTNIIAVARRYAVGDLQRPLPDYGDDELGDVARAMDQAVHELGRRVDDLSRDRTRMVAILSSMVEGVLVVDDQGRLQHVNDAARRMLNIHHDAVNHSYLQAIRHPGIVDQLTRVLAGDNPSGLELAVTRDVTRTLVARVAPVIAAGRGAVLVLHDITDLRRADRIRRDFVANVSHELRTPLTAIRGYVEALLDGPTHDVETTRFLEIVARHSARMEGLVKDLLRLARLDAGQEALELADVSVEGLFAGVAADLQPMTEGRAQQVSIAVLPPTLTMRCDPAKMHDVLRNLVENASAYTPEGSRIELGAAADATHVTLTVADTGQGIPDAELPRVFERFYRVDKARSRDSGGTGLGLSIVRHLVELHGGAVSASNRPEGGAVFTITLPRG